MAKNTPQRIIDRAYADGGTIVARAGSSTVIVQETHDIVGPVHTVTSGAGALVGTIALNKLGLITAGTAVDITGSVISGAYVAGTNIDITGAVISATATSLTPGDGIDITADVISVDLGTDSGLTFATGQLVMGLPTSLTKDTSDGVTGTTHSHNILSTANAAGTPDTILHGDANGDLTLRRLTLTDRLTAGANSSITGNLTLTTGDLFLDNDRIIYQDDVSGSARGIVQLNDLDNLELGDGTHVEHIFLRAVNYVRVPGDLEVGTDLRVENDASVDGTMTIDTLKANTFIAAVQRALVGGVVYGKSVTRLAESFTIPVAGATSTMYVEDIPDFGNMQAFTPGDTVGIQMYRVSTGIVLGVAYGTVTGYVDENSTQQSWQFESITGVFAPGTIAGAGSSVFDYGVDGDHTLTLTSAPAHAAGPIIQMAAIDTVTTPDPTEDDSVKVRLGYLDDLDTNQDGVHGQRDMTGLPTIGLYIDKDYTDPAAGWIELTDKHTGLNNVDLELSVSESPYLDMRPATGITIEAETSAIHAYNAQRGYTFEFEAAEAGGLFALQWTGGIGDSRELALYNPPGTDSPRIRIETDGGTADTTLELIASGASGGEASVTMTTNLGTSLLNASADTITINATQAQFSGDIIVDSTGVIRPDIDTGESITFTTASTITPENVLRIDTSANRLIIGTGANYIVSPASHALNIGLSVNSTGNFGSCIGAQAGLANQADYVNAVGYRAAHNMGAGGLGMTGAAYVDAFGSFAAQSNTGTNAAFFGRSAGTGNTANIVVGVGRNALLNNTGTQTAALGYQTGSGNTGAYSTLVGTYAGIGQDGDYTTFLGYRAGDENSQPYVTGVGAFAGRDNTGTNTTFVGYAAGDGNTTNNRIAIGNSNGELIDGIMSGTAANDSLTILANEVIAGSTEAADAILTVTSADTHSSYLKLGKTSDVNTAFLHADHSTGHMKVYTTNAVVMGTAGVGDFHSDTVEIAYQNGGGTGTWSVINMTSQQVLISDSASDVKFGAYGTFVADDGTNHANGFFDLDVNTSLDFTITGGDGVALRVGVGADGAFYVDRRLSLVAQINVTLHAVWR